MYRASISLRYRRIVSNTHYFSLNFPLRYSILSIPFVWLTDISTSALATAAVFWQQQQLYHQYVVINVASWTYNRRVHEVVAAKDIATRDTATWPPLPRSFADLLPLTVCQLSLNDWWGWLCVHASVCVCGTCGTLFLASRPIAGDFLNIPHPAATAARWAPRWFSSAADVRWRVLLYVDDLSVIREPVGRIYHCSHNGATHRTPRPGCARLGACRDRQDCLHDCSIRVRSRCIWGGHVYDERAISARWLVGLGTRRAPPLREIIR